MLGLILLKVVFLIAFVTLYRLDFNRLVCMTAMLAPGFVSFRHVAAINFAAAFYLISNFKSSLFCCGYFSTGKSFAIISAFITFIFSLMTLNRAAWSLNTIACRIIYRTAYHARKTLRCNAI
jgi:hypothetical protein